MKISNQSKGFVSLTILASFLALPFTGCDKDDENDSTPSLAEAYKPTQIIDTEDGEIMKLAYDSDNQLKRFVAEGLLETTYNFSYNPFTIKFDGYSFKDFTYDEKGCVLTYKGYDSDYSGVDSEYKLEYAGEYVNRITCTDNHDRHNGKPSQSVYDLVWNNGNLIKITYSTDAVYPYDLEVIDRIEFQYSNIPAKQWSMGLLDSMPDDSLIPLMASYQFPLSKNLISSAQHFRPESSSPYYVDTYSYRMNKNGSIDMEFWDDDTTDGFKYNY